MKKFTRLFSAFLVILVTAGCEKDQTLVLPTGSIPDPPPHPGIWAIYANVSLSREIRPFWPPGTSTWNWTAAGNSGGSAILEIRPVAPPGQELKYRWTFRPALQEHDFLHPVSLVPHDLRKWLPLRAGPGPWPDEHPLLPLPWVGLASGSYDNLIDFLKKITSNYFDSMICHWPELPIPVRLGEAQSHDLDLSDCLREALQLWNHTSGTTWFRVDESADWGVRLVHYPGATLRPPLEARITRLDELGRPRRINIVVGDNYDSQQDRPYAIRGFAHELGHCLFLWGHSQDRDHILWAAGPPLVDAPSEDERKAALLWHGLPEGLDLNDYLSEP